jgi:hypothetical protein
MTKRDSPLTERQEKWFKSLEDGLARDTGKTLDQWVKLAAGAPKDGGRRAQEKWLKDTYGIGVNRASAILSRAFPDGPSWDDPDALLAQLWTDAASRAIYNAVVKKVEKLPDVTIGPRKSFVAFSRHVQFGAMQPLKGGAARLALALDVSESKRFEPRKKSESFSDRLKGVIVLGLPSEVDAEVVRLLKAAHEVS